MCDVWLYRVGKYKIWVQNYSKHKITIVQNKLNKLSIIYIFIYLFSSLLCCTWLIFNISLLELCCQNVFVNKFTIMVTDSFILYCLTKLAQKCIKRRWKEKMLSNIMTNRWLQTFVFLLQLDRDGTHSWRWAYEELFLRISEVNGINAYMTCIHTYTHTIDLTNFHIRHSI